MEKENVKIDNQTRGLLKVIMAVLVVMAVIFTALLIVIVECAYLYTDKDNMYVISGKIESITDEEDYYSIKIADIDRNFVVSNLYTDVLDFEELTAALPENADVSLVVIKSMYDNGAEDVSVMSISNSESIILGLDDSIDIAIDDYNSVRVFCVCCLSVVLLLIIGNILLLSKTPKKIEINYYDSMAGSMGGEVAPIRKKMDIFALVYLGGTVLLAVVIAILGTYVGSPAFYIILGSFVALFIAATVVIICFMPKVRKAEIEFYTKLLSFENTDSFECKNSVVDVNNMSVISFSEEGLEFKKVLENPYNETQEPELFNSYKQEHAEDEKELKVPYDKLNLSAKCYYKPAGQMMAVVIRSNVEDKEILESKAYFNDGDLILNLDINLYKLIKEFSVKIDGLDECLKDVKTKMEENCKQNFATLISK